MGLTLSPGRPLRLAVWREYDHVHLLPPVARGFQLAQDRLRTAGHILVDFKGTSMKDVWTLQKEFVVLQDLRPLRKMIATEPVTEIVKRTGILFPEKSEPDITLDRLHELNERVAGLVVQMVQAWNTASASGGEGEGVEEIDAILGVPAAHTALPFDEYTDLGMTGLCNVIDWPAVVVPLGRRGEGGVVKKELGDFDHGKRVGVEMLRSETDGRLQNIFFGERQSEFEGLPLSVQVIGRRGMDERLLGVAEVVEKVLQC